MNFYLQTPKGLTISFSVSPLWFSLMIAGLGARLISQHLLPLIEIGLKAYEIWGKCSPDRQSNGGRL